jgi:putative endonuclease
MSQWFVYMLRCQDNTLYTGVTTDLSRRVKEHNGIAGKAKGAKYTKARRPVTLVYSESVDDRGAAQKREAALRRLSRDEKDELVNKFQCSKV